MLCNIEHTHKKTQDESLISQKIAINHIFLFYKYINNKIDF